MKSGFDLRRPAWRLAVTTVWLAMAGPVPGADGAGDRAASEGTLWLGKELVGVPEVAVETVIGTLPRLPRWLPGEYRGGEKGPEVRVVWPAPTDAASVVRAGAYTVTGRVAGTTLAPRAVVTVKPRSDGGESGPGRGLEAFPLDRVSLTADSRGRVTPFQRHRDLFLRGLARTQPDRFLYMFRDAFGQKQPEGVEPMGVWDSQTTRLRGHATGHYLSAIAQAYAGTARAQDAELRANFRGKMEHLMGVLHDLAGRSGRPEREGGPFHADPLTVPMGVGRTNYDSNLSREGIRTDYWNWGRGYLSAYPPDQFIMLERGAAYGDTNDRIWAPYYTLHKLLAGLLDCHEVGGDPRALEIARGMGLWVQRRLAAVPTATRIAMWNRYIAGEYGGMNEVMARLARLTGDGRFLECARLFDNIDFFYGGADHAHGLARNVDTLRGKHANQHIPQITGALEMYRNTGERAYYDIAENFWHLCIGGYAYSIGGVAGARKPDNAECFTAQPDTLFANGFGRVGQNETCATYNLLKLTRGLFLHRPEARYFDYYERALYNHILASVAADHPGNTYHVPLNPGARKEFGNPDMDGFTCCNGTALESGTKLQDSIYLRSADQRVLYLNLFVSSRLDWTERGVVLTQSTAFPFEDTTRIRIAGEGRFDLCLRVPGWATGGYRVWVNGREETVASGSASVPGTYLTLAREWKDQDVVEVRMPFRFRLDRLMDRPDVASLFYGPVLLAAQESTSRSDWRPVTLDVEDPGRSIDGDPASLRFRIGETEFRPFFESYGRYSVYLKVSAR